MWEYAKKLEMMDQVTGKSKLTERDALEVGRAIKDRALPDMLESGKKRPLKPVLDANVILKALIKDSSADNGLDLTTP
jgi:hypothetical protein